MSTAEKIKNHMKKEGLKYTWLSDKIGISKSHLSNILSGTKKFTPEINIKINKVLGTDFKL